MILSKIKSVALVILAGVSGFLAFVLQQNKIRSQRKKVKALRKEVDRAKRRQENRKNNEGLDESGRRDNINRMFKPSHDKGSSGKSKR